jgi:sialate O-acetylesterase
MKTKTTPVLIAVLLLLAGVLPAHSAITLPTLIGDQMVLQRDTPAPIWGRADAGEEVTVTFDGQKKSTVADAQGAWAVKLDPMPASAAPRELAISGKDASTKVADVLVGDVWVASGQSNMAFTLAAAHNGKEALAKADDPQLRFFMVPQKTAAEPQSDCPGKWDPATPQSAKNFSAVAYFFSQVIRNEEKVPVGVLQAAWGGTDIETWISLAGLKKNPPLTTPLGRWDQAMLEYEKAKANPQLAADYEVELKKWQAEVAPKYNAELKQWNTDKDSGKPVGPRPQPERPEPVNPDPMAIPGPGRRPSTPTVNFNGMVAPLTPFAIRGVIWYQGENNRSRGIEYRALFRRLIEDWRDQWKPVGCGDLPFLFVQLPCFDKDKTPVAEGGLPLLREAQSMALQLPRTGMAVTIDVGDPNDVHPANKIDVGRRLALAARKLVYAEKVVGSSPLFQSLEIKGSQARLRFTETGSGLTIGEAPWRPAGVEPLPTDKLLGFYIAGSDKVWHEADATIDGDSVVGSCPAVPEPAAVRYAWANSPRCNLYNKEGLPASPFRSDDWPDVKK